MNIFITLKHLFIPAFSNNQKAKVLHHTSLLFFILGLIAYQVFLQTIPLSGVRILGFASQISTSDVIALTNQKRVEEGLSPLTQNAQLTQAALAKGQHMLEYDYWAHIAPDGTEPWKFISSAGYTYRFAGENLARDFSSATSAVEAWMTSPSHRENLLSAKYSDIGIAVVEGDLGGVDTTLIVQFFGSTTTASSQLAGAVVTTAPKPTTLPLPTSLPTAIPTDEVSPIPTQIVNIPTQSLNFPTTISENVLTVSEPAEEQVLISPFTTTRQVSILTVLFILVVFIIDAFVMRRKRLNRIGGRVLAHVAFLGMILAIALIIRSGSIL